MTQELARLIKHLGLVTFIIAGFLIGTYAQSPSPSPTPDDKRGIGIQSTTLENSSQPSSQSREAKPELVLQTGYNNIFGAMRMVFSPDGRLLATATFRSSTIKLWETATGRELRNLSSGTQSAAGMSPFIAFSRDGRVIAAAAGDNSVKIWDVITGREVQTLAAQQGSITASLAGVYFIAFSADSRVVTISDAIRVWDQTTGRELRSIPLESLSVSGLMGGEGGAALSPDGNQLALIFAEGSGAQIKFWDLATGREARAVNLSDKELESAELSFAPDGHLFVAGTVNKHLKLWDLTTKGKERDLGPTTAEFDLIKFSRDGRLLALSEGYTVRLWEVATGRELSPLKAPNSGIFAGQGRVFACFAEDSKRIATSGFDTPTMLWESDTGKQLIKMNGRTNMAYKVAFSADGHQLSSGGRTRWDLRTGRGLRINANPLESSFGIPSPDGRLLAAFTPHNNTLTILETPSGRVLQTLTPTSGGGVVQRASFSPDGTLIVTIYGPNDQQLRQPQSNQPAGNENQVKIWEVKSGRELHSLTLDNAPLEVGFSRDGRVLATLGAVGRVSLWDTQSGSRLRDLTSSPMGSLGSLGSMKPGQIKPGSIPSISSMPNMADLSAMMTNVMGAMSAGTMGRMVTSIAFSPDGRTVATGGVESKSNFDMASLMAGGTSSKKSKSKKPPDYQDLMKDMKVEAVGQVVLWDAATGSEIGVLKGHGKGVTQVAFSRDGRFVASGSTDNTIRIWEVATKRELRTLVGHTANIESIDFSPDGRLLASASEDGGTFLWDATTGEHLLTLISLDDGGEWMVVTPQGLFDGTPVSWNQILWRYNQDTFNVAPIEWFFNEFYYPGLLADITAGKRPRVALDVSKKDRRQPLVKLSLVGEAAPGTGISVRTAKVRIEVTDATADKDNPQGSGARDVRLFRNGSLARVWHGDVLNGKAAVTLEEDVTIAAGANRLTAYAFNKDNVKSKDAQLALTGAESLARAGTAYVIAVGINEYANPQYNLKYAVADAQSFGEEVRHRLSDATRFEHFEVVPLINEKATKDNILS
ncbi:MAG: WD40 repeat domain-containing protein, partial [Acidobacteriota bacterium]|nr:WD40 repeat domain-containing protein [Acidobacteriota bacterium]